MTSSTSADPSANNPSADNASLKNPSADNASPNNAGRAVIPLVPITLDHPSAADPAVAGTKGAGLATLRAAGFDVPDAVILPIGIADSWPSGMAPGAVRAGVELACTTLGDRLAVRSSATWEDGAAGAHAGATATVLDVGGVDAVLAAVRRCLDASTSAGHARGVDGDLAIVLQRLVPAEWAGVAFTADPLTGERNLVRIAATPGLGEALVQGEVIGTDLVVRGDTIAGERDGLADRDIVAVAEVARAVDAHHGRPQDIEWALADGRIHLLQARPITVLPVEPVYPEGNNWQKDTAHYPEPLTPFGWTVIEATEGEIRAVFDEMGLLVRGLEEVSVGGQIYGRVLPAFGSANSASKPPPALVMGIAARLVPELRRRTAVARRAVEADLAGRWADEWHRTLRAEMQQRHDELLAVDMTGMDDAALAAHGDVLLALAQRGIRIHFRLVMPLARALHRLHTIVGDELGWDDATMMSMLAGHSPATRAAGDDLVDLRRRIRAIDGAAASLAADPGRPVKVLGRHDPSLAADLQHWLDEHGWAMVNYDAGVAVMAERPTMVTRLLLSEPTPADHDTTDKLAGQARAELPEHRRADFDDALRDARAIYPVREDNTIVVGDRPLALLRRWMLEVAGRLVDRGHLASVSDGPYVQLNELRDSLIGPTPGDLGERVGRRRGEEAWARANPGPLHLGDQAQPPDISRLPLPLRQVNQPVLWMIAHEYPAPAEPTEDPAVLLAGVASAAGEAEGTVRVITGHDDLQRLRDGDVLVCQVTSPSWAPLFPLAAAIVADGGGVLSHAAIAAREHGIPAVLGTGAGTTTLKDGQRVRVDGTRGLVLATGRGAPTR